MALARPIEPITASDDELRDALDVADLPALLPALAHVTGDLSLLRPELRIDPLLMGEDQGGLTPEQQAAIRALALDDADRVPRRWQRRRRRCRPGRLRAHPRVHGRRSGDRRVPADDARGAGADGRPAGAAWHKDDVNPDKPFKVVIIGAGMSGIVAAYRLAEADVPYVVIDKNADVGGTWLENSYPGCRVDIPNHYYSYSFAQRDDWPLYYSPRAELYRYFRECVDEFGIRPNIRFNTEVSSVEYDDEPATWTVCTVDTDRQRSATSRPTR